MKRTLASARIHPHENTIVLFQHQGGYRMSKIDSKSEAVLTSREAAQLLKISPATLQRLARAGKVPAIKIGKLWRYSNSALDEWVQSEVSSFRHPCRK